MNEQNVFPLLAGIYGMLAQAETVDIQFLELAREGGAWTVAGILLVFFLRMVTRAVPDMKGEITELNQTLSGVKQELALLREEVRFLHSNDVIIRERCFGQGEESK